MIFILLVITVSLYLAYVYIVSSDYRTKLSKIKSERSLPIIGHAHKIGWNNADILPTLEKMWTNTGKDKFLLKIGPANHVVLTKPEDIEMILITHKVIKKSNIYKSLISFLGDGILTAEASKWLVIRKTLNPAFYNKVIESHISAYESEANAAIKEILSKPNQNVEIQDLFEKSMLRVLTTTGIGLNITIDDEYLNTISEVMADMNDRFFSLWKSINCLYNLTSKGKVFIKNKKKVYEKNFKALIAKKESHKDLLEDINSGKKTMEAISNEEEFFKRRLGVLDLMVLSKKANGEHFNFEETVEAVLTFTLAGMETSSAAVAFTLYILAKHKDIQDKVFQEQLSVTNNDLTKAVTFKTMKEMKYLEAVVKESMRMYSPVPLFGRKLIEDIVLADGTELPAGVDLLILPYLSQRNPFFFPDPEKFDPNRFIDSVIPPYSYYPFSLGPRDCIGKGLGMILVKFYLAFLLRTLEFYPSPKEFDIKLTTEISLKSTNGIHVRWRKREV